MEPVGYEYWVAENGVYNKCFSVTDPRDKTANVHFLKKCYPID